MERMEQVCCGDCSKCQLPQAGQMQTMMACAIDQIFQKTQATEFIVLELKEQVEGLVLSDTLKESDKKVTLASVKNE